MRVRPWLTVVARNTCFDEQRRRRPDLPGELPERAAHGEDPFQLDAALNDAWSRLSGRHREVLYLREVLGFSYKEIAAVMGVTMAATETLVFRARASLRREYERSGGSSFGCVLLGLQLAHLGAGPRRDGMTDQMSTVVANDAGLNGLTGRLAHFLTTSLPGCGEQAMAKVFSVAAGVIMAAASVTAGFGPFAGTSPASADDAPAATALAAPVAPAVTLAAAPTVGSLGGNSSAVSTAAIKPMALKALVGNALPADWAPRSRSETAPASASGSGGEADVRPQRITPLRDAAAAARSSDRPTLRRGDSSEGPLRSLLPDRPRRGDVPERPHPLRTLISDARPLLTDPLLYEFAPPPEPTPTEPTPTEPTLAGVFDDLAATEPARPGVKETLEPVIATFAADEPNPVRLRHR